MLPIPSPSEDTILITGSKNLTEAQKKEIKNKYIKEYNNQVANQKSPEEAQQYYRDMVKKKAMELDKARYELYLGEIKVAELEEKQRNRENIVSRVLKRAGNDVKDYWITAHENYKRDSELISKKDFHPASKTLQTMGVAIHHHIGKPLGDVVTGISDPISKFREDTAGPIGRYLGKKINPYVPNNIKEKAEVAAQKTNKVINETINEVSESYSSLSEETRGNIVGAFQISEISMLGKGLKGFKGLNSGKTVNGSSFFTDNKMLPNSKPVVSIDKSSILSNIRGKVKIDSKAKKHILEGDKTGGGHRFGTRKPRKSEFPKSWSDNKILTEIENIVNDNKNSWSKSNKSNHYVTTTKKIDGVDIKVVFDKKNERIVSAYPINTPRNPK